MKTPIATMALAAALAAPALAPGRAQAPSGRRAGGGTTTTPTANPPRSPVRTPGAATNAAQAPAGQPVRLLPSNTQPKTDAAVLPADSVVPEPVPLDQLPNPALNLASVNIDPFIVRKENGPFMVMARTFRGPQATEYALALAMELRNAHRLPAYIFHLKVQPGGSNIRNVQPTATEAVPNADIAAPEKFRVFDEAAVLVGDCKTIDDAESLLHRLRKHKLNSLETLPTIWGQRKGTLKYGSFVTQNPLVAAQQLYPGGHLDGGHGPAGSAPVKPGQAFDPYVAAAAFQQAPKHDPLVESMNRGPHSIYKCPGPYTLPVAEFAGRATVDLNDPRFKNDSFLSKSPLATAIDDAESLAACLTKCKALNPQFRPYVYHDRYGSKVTLGSFNGPDDPRIAELRKEIPAVIGELFQRKLTEIPLAPSPYVMSVPRP